ncbi:hypothetical protein JHK87_041899 [Glycine soja]|nr:hypothetical protein JHK87_041899 [Glycine soja]
MISSMKCTASSLTCSAFSNRKIPIARPQLVTLPTINNVEQNTGLSQLCSQKPLYLSSTENLALVKRRRETECQAYEADRSRPLEINIELPGEEAAQRFKIGLYFATWWALNVVFNIYNKKVLNAFPYPWLTSTLSLAAGSLMMLVSWATRVAEVPKVNLDFWKALFPVAVAHTIGHVAATVSMSKVAVSFTHIIKSGEPAFSVLVSRFLLGEAFPMPVYLSLLPIIGGCALAAVTELNFNMIERTLDVSGFMGAMISNLAFVFRNIFSKKGMKGMSVSGMNYYACLSIMSLLILTPFAIAVEGPKVWIAGWQTAVSQIGPNFVWWVAAQSVFYHLYNQVSYMSLDQISPLTFSIGNTMKRISVIVSSILIFHTPVQPINALGAAIAILGTFLYSQLPLLAHHALFALSFCISIFLASCDDDFLSVKKNSSSSPFPSNFLFGTASSSYQEDVDLMDYIGVNSYRFSLSWARILPKIEPFVTMSHYDIPLELEERYGGWLSPEIQEDFKYYANICFKNFGDRVKYWVTFNEPNVATIRGYRTGMWPPSRCSGSFGNCSYGGDSEREPFIAASNLLLSHAVAVDLYRTKYQGGKIGVVMNAIWFEPVSNSWKDKLAAERAQSFYMNWFLDPIIIGEYPAEMHEILGQDLPTFSRYDVEKLKSGLDFIGVNHYTSAFAKDCIFSACEQGRGSSRTEGIGMRENSNHATKEIINDVERVEYLRGYLDSLATAIRKGADVRGYFVWSLLDNFEWTDGYSIRFGLHHVDYATLNRTPRMSAFWYKNFIALHAPRAGTRPQHTQE